MLISVSYMDLVMKMAGSLLRNVGSAFQIVEFHNETCFTIYIQKFGVDWFVPTSKYNDVSGNVIHSTLFIGVHIQVYAEFLQRPIFHYHRYVEFCTMMAFTRTTSKKV